MHHPEPRRPLPMSPLLLIDGYNLSEPIAPVRRPDPRWLERNRNRLLNDLARHLDEAIRGRTCVVFDATDPPKDRPQRYTHHAIDVRFAVGYLSADDLLEEIIGAHHTPKRLMVVSSDHRIQIAAKRRGAKFADSQPWLDDLTDGKVRLAIRLAKLSGGSGGDGAGQGGGAAGEAAAGQTPRVKKPRIQDPDEVADWMRQFGFEPE